MPNQAQIYIFHLNDICWWIVKVFPWHIHLNNFLDPGNWWSSDDEGFWDTAFRNGQPNQNLFRKLLFLFELNCIRSLIMSFGPKARIFWIIWIGKSEIFFIIHNNRAVRFQIASIKSTRFCWYFTKLFFRVFWRFFSLSVEDSFLFQNSYHRPLRTVK